VPVLVDFLGGLVWSLPHGGARGPSHGDGDGRARPVVLKVDTDKHPELAQRYGVRGIPKLLVMKDGQVCASSPATCPTRSS